MSATDFYRAIAGVGCSLRTQDATVVVGQAGPAEPAICPLPTPELPAKPRRPRWQEKYKQVIELHAQKRSARAIARELALDRGTIRRWLKAGCLPERAGRRRGSRVDAWQEYLATRWQAGCHNAVILANELRERGFTGSYSPVRRFVSQWRSQEATGSIVTITRPRAPSAKSMAWWLLTPPEKLNADQRHCVEIFCAACPSAVKGATIAEEFARMVREHELARLGDWLRQASSSEIPIEMRRFARGIQADLAAVQGALSLPWSNGQTEGQVNRLKLIKRQMYGRANFDLRRQRVLARPA